MYNFNQFKLFIILDKILFLNTKQLNTYYEDNYCYGVNNDHLYRNYIIGTYTVYLYLYII